MLKKIIILVSFSMFATPLALANKNDWRKNSSTDKKLENLIKVIPSTSDLMIQMGERYKNLYWAGKQEKWDFADYQIDEMQALIRTLKITRPKRSKSIDTHFKNAFSDIQKAIKENNWSKFSSGFDSMRHKCMACHRANDHAFIVLNPKPAKGNSPALD